MPYASSPSEVLWALDIGPNVRTRRQRLNAGIMFLETPVTRGRSKIIILCESFFAKICVGINSASFDQIRRVCCSLSTSTLVVSGMTRHTSTRKAMPTLCKAVYRALPSRPTSETRHRRERVFPSSKRGSTGVASAPRCSNEPLHRRHIARRDIAGMCRYIHAPNA